MFRTMPSQIRTLVTRFVALVLLLGPPTTIAEQCSPVKWSTTTQIVSGTPTIGIEYIPFSPDDIIEREIPQPGEINCRYTTFPYDDVDENTCAKICKKYGITMEKFVMLNPGMEEDCSNIRTGVEYCVSGFIEPLRAYDGLCGPKHKNATCIGTEYQCCNAETWRCGDSKEDCAPGTCYEGACAGNKVYSTDGTCGHQHGSRLCAGKWGDCCNVDGKCGTGESFCGSESCQSGNCMDSREAEPST